jgi:DNA-binding winged helix-turn-helix (wHTH) protein
MRRYRFSEFILSPRRRMLVRNGRELPLIPRYFDLLLFLIEHRGEAVHRRDIFDRVWSDVVVSDSALSQAIRTIRRVLGDDSRAPRFVRTVSRHGYRFVYADVVEEDDDGEWQAADVAAPDRELFLQRLTHLAASVRWTGAAIGGGLAGLFAGAAGGLILAAAPDSTAPSSPCLPASARAAALLVVRAPARVCRRLSRSRGSRAPSP